ncbi:orotidine 5'phosphate decarboxylase-orotate phosphoribosyltransferase [Candidatus Magnetobacterium bavaricum]|uniref:Orotidine 5'phosphate decarboxylase-orotate phosphoribosyltransferase n=1 Tax=Candidatus Magnetobacterium bavaricum TaxID=29290 RepID=A0A0F3GMJ3_9BACT|nr:orotidine 5'phosphate decarboxylase-orotate phosphoribosyltransferase [Candidatus Magnetobacterium bavaricum]
MNRQQWSKDLIIDLYKEGYLQTLWNAAEQKNRAEGWRLKSGIWSPWFFNMRHVGSSPKLFYDLCSAMADMIAQHDVSLLIGIEMAGIPLVGGIAVAMFTQHNKPQAIGFTRPLPKKARTSTETLHLLQNYDELAGSYGQKSLVEARLSQQDNVGIVDDMATDLESKIMARLLVLREAQRQGINLQCNKIFYILNRNKGNRQKGLDFANEKAPQLYPAALEVNYIIEFDDALPFLRPCMRSEEYEVVVAFQENRTRFQDEQTQKDLIKLANR